MLYLESMFRFWLSSTIPSKLASISHLFIASAMVVTHRLLSMLSLLIWFPLQSFAFKYSLKSKFHIRLIPLGLDYLFSPTDYRLFGTIPTSLCWKLSLILEQWLGWCWVVTVLCFRGCGVGYRSLRYLFHGLPRVSCYFCPLCLNPHPLCIGVPFF